ncbi:MAG: GGDEF domain-containing protein [Gammaproteobacteria bacterium]|nr:GGDEF domain-containing protein [Gammaproteobacteria bacterium]
MNSPNSIVNHIQKFTSQRDNELIAFSLMQSINDMLSPKYQSIVTVTKFNEISKQFTLRNGSGVFLDENFEVEKNFLECLATMETQNLEQYSNYSENGHTLYFLINNFRNETDYFFITTETRLSKVQEYLLSGMFKIFKNYNELLNDSQTDQLTGLLNRKTFDTSINRYWGKVDEHFKPEKRVQGESVANWLVIIDIDHFKAINDSYGHLFGDEILILVSNLLKTQFRSNDLIFRFGGEEFVILMRDVAEHECKIKLEDVKQAIANYAFPKLDKLTVSMGACMLSQELFYMTVLDCADKALYQSKSNGRNQITFFDHLTIQSPEEKNFSEIDLF